MSTQLLMNELSIKGRHVLGNCYNCQATWIIDNIDNITMNNLSKRFCCNHCGMNDAQMIVKEISYNKNGSAIEEDITSELYDKILLKSLDRERSEHKYNSPDVVICSQCKKLMTHNTESATSNTASFNTESATSNIESGTSNTESATSNIESGASNIELPIVNTYNTTTRSSRATKTNAVIPLQKKIVNNINIRVFNDGVLKTTTMTRTSSCNHCKSGCIKKYCPCFKAGNKCGSNCNCKHCNN